MSITRHRLWSDIFLLHGPRVGDRCFGLSHTLRNSCRRRRLTVTDSIYTLSGIW